MNKNGNKKSDERLILQDANIEELITNHSLKEIGEIYNVSIDLASKVVTSHFRNKNLQRFNKHYRSEITEMNLDCDGAWAELKATDLYKQLTK